MTPRSPSHDLHDSPAPRWRGRLLVAVVSGLVVGAVLTIGILVNLQVLAPSAEPDPVGNLVPVLTGTTVATAPATTSRTTPTARPSHHHRTHHATRTTPATTPARTTPTRPVTGATHTSTVPPATVHEGSGSGSRPHDGGDDDHGGDDD